MQDPSPVSSLAPRFAVTALLLLGCAAAAVPPAACLTASTPSPVADAGVPAVPGTAAFPPLESARSAVVIAPPFDAPDRWRWWRGRGNPDLYRNGGRVRGPSALGTAFLFLDRGLLVGTPDAAARGGGVIVAAEVHHPAPRWQLALAPADYMTRRSRSATT